jgi:YVTN family beta-propeller protein
MKRIAVAGCVALGTVGVMTAALSGARAGGKASGIENERELIVTLVTPTLNQEVAPDLSDPGLNNVITVRFSSLIPNREIVDNQNVVNRLRDKVEFLDATFARLPGTPSVRRNIFTFSPLSSATPVLPQGQYMLNLKSSIRNTRGRLLNKGLADYTTAFSVGTDVYAPVLRKLTPIQAQQGIGLFQPITVTMNEPISSNNLATTVFVQDASTNPPTAIPGAGGTGVSLARNGFDVVFTPDPCFGYPPKTNIQFIMQGQIGPTAPANTPQIATTVEDMFQNDFRRDLSLRWSQDPVNLTLFHSPLGDYDDFTGQFRMTFQTKGTKTPPVGLRPGGNRMTAAYGPPYLAPCAVLVWFAPSCFASGNVLYYTTDSGLGEIDLRAHITRFNQGITDFSLISILPNTPVRLGRPAGVTLDPRVLLPGNGPYSYHTFIYVVDERSGTVQVVRSDNLRILGRLSGFSSPRDVGISTNTGQVQTTLYVSNFGAKQVVGLDLEGIKVSFTGQPGAPSPCAAIKDNQKNRAIIQVGSGPTEVAADSYLNQRVFVTNTLEDSLTMIDPRSNKVLNTFEVGSNPVCVDWNTIGFGSIRLGLTANQGGFIDPNGSASLYVFAPPLSGGFLGAAQVRDGIESTLTDGVKNPTHCWGNISWINGLLDSSPVYWFLSNTGGTTALDLRLNVAGLFGLSITPSTRTTIPVGLNPTSTVPDAFYPNFRGFSSVVGTGSLAAYDPNRSLPPTLIRVPGIRRLYTCYTQ